MSKKKFTLAEFGNLHRTVLKLNASLDIGFIEYDNISIVDRIPAKKLATEILKQAESGHLNMDDWHTCKTTHCVAGWAIVLHGKDGEALEDMLGGSYTEEAGKLLFPEFANHFFDSNEEAITLLRKIAGKTKK